MESSFFFFGSLRRMFEIRKNHDTVIVSRLGNRYFTKVRVYGSTRFAASSYEPALRDVQLRLCKKKEEKKRKTEL